MKKRTISLASLLSAVAISSLAAPSAFAFDKGSTDGVVGVLLKKYTLTETTYDKAQITHQGAALSMKQAGVYSGPAKSIVVWNSTVQDGKVLKQNIFMSSSCGKAHCHVLQSDEKVYVTKIESKDDPKNDVLKFSIVSVEDIDGGDGAERYGATVTFKFKKGYLAEASPEDVEQAVEAVMAPDDGSGGDAKQDTTAKNDPPPAPAQPTAPIQRAAPAPCPASAVPSGPPPTLAIGESSSKVLKGYGMPTDIIDLDKKKIYVYKDVKITFIDDKITAMQ